MTHISQSKSDANHTKSDSGPFCMCDIGLHFLSNQQPTKKNHHRAMKESGFNKNRCSSSCQTNYQQLESPSNRLDTLPIRCVTYGALFCIGFTLLFGIYYWQVGKRIISIWFWFIIFCLFLGFENNRPFVVIAKKGDNLRTKKYKKQMVW